MADGDSKLRILCIGAHHDDCEVTIGGTAAMWAAAGHTVRFVSATTGETGHYSIGGVTLTQMRLAEAAASAKVLGVDYETLPISNGGIVASLEYRRLFIRLIRQFRPDLVLTNRPWDYHPDHRYTSQLVQDSAYVVTVPNNTPEVPALDYNPVIAHWWDHFTKPCPFEPTVVIAIDDTIEKKYDALHQHTSQMYDWIPFNQGVLDQVPEGDVERRAWLFERRKKRDIGIADRYRDKLVERYGEQRGRAVKYAEAFEGCEYGSALSEEKIARLFAGM